MRKLVLLTLLFTPIVYSQSIEVSVSGGAGISNTYNTRFTSDSTDYSLSYNTGASVQYNFDEINTIRFETTYFRKGSNFNQLDYITVSPFAQFHVNEKVKIYFVIGAYFGFAINPGIKYYTFDVGANVGIGYKQNLFKNKLFAFIEVRDNMGLCNVGKTQRLSNHALTGNIGLSYRF